MLSILVVKFKVMLKVIMDNHIAVDREGTIPITVPYLSYSMQENFYSVGLLCEVFFSHAWDDPFLRQHRLY